MRIVKKNIGRFVFAIILISVISFVFVYQCAGAEDRQLPDEYYSMIYSLPEEMKEYLPGGMASDDPEEVEKAILKLSSSEYILTTLSSFIKLGVGEAAKLLCLITGILVIAAIFSAFKEALGSSGLDKALSLCSSGALLCVILSAQRGHLERVGEYFERLSSLMLGIIPTLGVIYAMGGNVTTALVNNSSLYLMLSFCESFCALTFLPVSSLCTAFSLSSAIAPALNLRSLSSAIKKCYTFVIGIVMTVLLFSLSSQTVLSASADSISARAAKLVAANIIPIVGGSVGETLRTLASSVSYLKNVSGIGAIALIVILVLPTLISLLLYRFVLIISVSLADVLGCDVESRFLSDIGYVYGMLLAVVSMSAMAFVLALTVFLRSTVAVV